jgi:bifunctional UDP-N-acetylglucosamine pyrophosphorylase/glucosamine-1-phosphate N-acetyltransferase
MAVAQGLTVESVESRDRYETLGVNNRVQLAEAECALQARIRERWMLNGVSMPDPASVYVDADVDIGVDTTVLPNTHIKGKTSIGQDCEIGPNSMVIDSRIGDACQIVASVISGSTLDEGVDVGPYSHIRPGSHLQTNVHIGNFAEVKNSRLGPETKSGHFSYIGDAELGTNVNVGAGSITCNFDGDEKHLTEIGDNAFIGSDSLLIAPVKVESGAATGAGSIVNRTVPENSMWVGDRASARVIPIRKRKRKK